MNARNDDAWIGELLWGIASLVGLFVFGLFLISQWLTRLLIEQVINPLLGGWLEKHDGAVVLLSAVLWGVVTITLIYPLLLVNEVIVVPPGQEITATRYALTCGLLWGVLCGAYCVMVMFQEVDAHLDAADFTQTLEVPAEIYRYQGAANTPALQTPELTAAEIDALFNPVPLALEGRTNGTHPQPVHG